MTNFSSPPSEKFAEIASELPDSTTLDSGDKVALLTNDIGTENWSHSLHSDNVNGVAVSDATGQVISGSFDNTVRSVDISTGNQNWSHSLHSDNVNGVAVSDATGQVISGSADNTVRSVDISTGTENWSHSLHSSRVNGVAVSDATGQVISVSDDNTVKSVDSITTAKEIIKSDNNRLYQLQ